MSDKELSEKMLGIMNRIKNRREELKLSYQDMADKTGLSKSTLQRYETGYIKNMPLDKLDIVASALQCSQAYLMGWDTQCNIHKADEFFLSDLEKDIIRKFRTLSNGERSMFLRSIGVEEKGESEKMA